MRDMLVAAGFVDIAITVKENAAEIIKGWMPGSGAEKFVTSAYITATKPTGSWGVRDNVRANTSAADFASGASVAKAEPKVEAEKPKMEAEKPIEEPVASTEGGCGPSASAGC